MGWLWGSFLVLLQVGQVASSVQSQTPEGHLLDWVHAKGGWVGVQFILSVSRRVLLLTLYILYAIAVSGPLR